VATQGHLELNIHGASESYKFDLRGSATYAGRAITGSWSEFKMLPRPCLARSKAPAFRSSKESTFTANMSLMTRGDKQSVTIKSQDAQAEVQGATINLQRG